MVAIGGMFAEKGAYFSMPITYYLCDENMNRLYEQNGNKLITIEESERRKAFTGEPPAPW